MEINFLDIPDEGTEVGPEQPRALIINQEPTKVYFFSTSGEVADVHKSTELKTISPGGYFRCLGSHCLGCELDLKTEQMMILPVYSYPDRRVGLLKAQWNSHNRSKIAPILKSPNELDKVANIKGSPWRLEVFRIHQTELRVPKSAIEDYKNWRTLGGSLKDASYPLFTRDELFEFDVVRDMARDVGIDLPVRFVLEDEQVEGDLANQRAVASNVYVASSADAKDNKIPQISSQAQLPFTPAIEDEEEL